MVNVLLSAVGRRVYLVEWFKEILHPIGGKVYATNTMQDATGFLAADESAVVPGSIDKNYIDVMTSLCKKWEISLLFSLHDWDAPIIARAKDMFLSNGTLPVVGSFKLHSICLDKYATAKEMEGLGIKSPKTFLTLEDALMYNRFPMIVKPRWGQGSLGLFKVFSREELEAAYILSTSQARKFAKYCDGIEVNEQQVVIQECIDAMEYGCDIINDFSGKFRGAFVKHKFAMRSGETDAAESVYMPEIERAAEKVANWSRHLGCMDSDWFVMDNGEPVLIELNPRFGGGYPFTHCAGANVPLACINWVRGIDTDSWRTNYKIGVRLFKSISMMRAHENVK